MSKKFVRELEASMDAFLSTSSDEELLAALQRADNGVYGNVDFPIIDMHEHILPNFYHLSTCTMELQADHELPLGGMRTSNIIRAVCEPPDVASSELAFAA